MDNRTQKAVIVELYEELRRHMDKGSELMPMFLKMVDSLRYLKEEMKDNNKKKKLENTNFYEKMMDHVGFLHSLTSSPIWDEDGS